MSAIGLPISYCHDSESYPIVLLEDNPISHTDITMTHDHDTSLNLLQQVETHYQLTMNQIVYRL